MNSVQRENRLEQKKKVWNAAYDRAVCSTSIGNRARVIRGFMEKGIPKEDIKPSENVFTYAAWKAQGRYVRKGEHGVSLPVVYDKTEKASEPVYDENEMEVESGKEKHYRIRTGATVFHISQTEKMTIKGA
jgi:hypothetical protein